MRTPGDYDDDTGAGLQMSLIDPVPFSPKMPKSTTLEAALLRELLSGAVLTHPEFERTHSSWRCAAYVERLRKLGWPIISIPLKFPCPANPRRIIARYKMPQWVIGYMRAQA